jgi:hypothetical protein
MQYIVTIDTSNAAFDDSVSAELEWILQRLARELHSTHRPPARMKLRDSNGLTVGEAIYTTSEN